ncbi:Sugar phosphate permease [Paraburkholderia hospita]|nr:MFS transporter [Paraburkholderia hospita]EUC15265.1 major facilitator superfamily MFS_1 [Burkholderia sp. BT03]AUT73025.1 MFS transporter [Paraburkholderia hospita]OUL88631.1 MFS transporter [Paraburkholderia hospita]OUL90619.1 MFS transporter [Paraburkholderia hospita]SEI27456.1 Sugar phosphate permease [Paraburkholderia hospita]
MNGTSSETRDTLDGIVSQVMRRLLPFLLLMYVLAFLDRANIGFAQKALQHDTGISNAAFAFGAGVFFVGYALFEVPSNLLLHRVGARLWMCRIMVTWGLVSAAMSLAHTATTFYALRFLLGVAEAGFFPGVIYYLTRWFPQSARARAVGVFYFGAPLAFMFGSPLSGFLLELHGALNLAGWQWLFLIEGGLASVVGVWAFFYLDDRPEDASWLTPQARKTLSAALDDDARAASAHGPRNLLAALVDKRVLLFSAIYLLIQMSVYGVIFYLPQQVAALMGESVGLRVGMVAAVPWICALALTWFVPRRADATGTHRRWAVALLVLAGCGIGVSGATHSPLLAMAALCCAASGFIAAQPLFWTFPTRYLTGAAAAGGIALINSLGSLGGFIAPTLRTSAEHAFQSTSAGLLLLGAASLLAALLIGTLVRRDATRDTPAFPQPIHRAR